MSTNVFITIMTECLIHKCGSVKLIRKLSRAPQGRRLGDDRLEVLEVLVALHILFVFK